MPTIISEFSPSSDGRHFSGTCTQASSAMALTMAEPTRNQSYQSVVNLMIAMRDDMANRGWLTAANGASTIAAMANELHVQGADIDLQVNYQTGYDLMAYDWISYLRANAGIKPIVLQLLKTYNLKTINPWNANVECHAISVLGKQTNGYIVGDPNRPAGNTQPMIYPLSALQAASPCALIGLRPKAVSTPTPTGGTMNYPKGWDKTGDGMLAPASSIDGKRYLVRGGIQMTLEKIGLLRDDNVPIEDIHQDTDKVWRQAFTHFGLYWIDDSHYGLDAVVSRQRKQISDLQNQLSGPGAVASITAVQALKKAWSLV